MVSSERDNITIVTNNIAVEVAKVDVNEDIRYPRIQKDQENTTTKNDRWVYDLESTLFLPRVALGSKNIVNLIPRFPWQIEWNAFFISTTQQFVKQQTIVIVRWLYVK